MEGKLGQEICYVVHEDLITMEPDDWARVLGTPQPNSAIYLPKDNLSRRVKPS